MFSCTTAIQHHSPCTSVSGFMICRGFRRRVNIDSLFCFFIARTDLFHGSKGGESKRCGGLIFKTVYAIKVYAVVTGPILLPLPLLVGP